METSNKLNQMKIALTFGVFDLLHYGHFRLFRQIKKIIGQDGILIVALQKDEWVGKYKAVKIVYDFEKRKEMIETLRTVDFVVPYESVSVETVKKIKFDILCVGPEHNNERFQQVFAWCKANGKEVKVIPRTEGISTTLLKNIIKEL